MDCHRTTVSSGTPQFLDFSKLNNEACQEKENPSVVHSGGREGSTRKLESSAKTVKVYNKKSEEEKQLRASRRASLDDKTLQLLSKQEIFSFICEELPNIYRDLGKRDRFAFQKERKSDLVKYIDKRILNKDLTHPVVLEEMFIFLQKCIQYQGKGVIENVTKYILSKNLPDHKLIPFIEKMIERSARCTSSSMPFAEDNPGVILYAEYIKRRFETHLTRGAFTKCALEVIENSQDIDVNSYIVDKGVIDWTYWEQLKNRREQLAFSFLKNVANLLKNIQENMEKDKDLLNDVKILNHCLLSNIKKKSKHKQFRPEQILLQIFVRRIICTDFIPLIKMFSPPPFNNDLMSIKEDLEYIMNITKLLVDYSESLKRPDLKVKKSLSLITDFLVQEPAPLQEVDTNAEPDLENNVVAQILNLVPTNNADNGSDKDADTELDIESDIDSNTAHLNERIISRLSGSFRRLGIKDKEKKVKVII